MQNQLVDLTLKLLKFRTTHDRPDEIAACVRFVKEFFENTELTIEHHEHKGVHSVYVSKGTRKPRVLLNGHLDVVDAEDHAFDPQVRDGRIYGRGSLDMKSGNAVMMQVMKDIAEGDEDVALLLTTDEEIGGFYGVQHMIKKDYLAGVVLVPDGGQAPDQIIQKQKGLIHFRVIAHGISAHGSVPWKGDNAIMKLTHALVQLESVFPNPTADQPWGTTFTVGKIKGGTATNQVPAEATAFCDIRFTEQETLDDVLYRVKEALPDNVELEVDIESDAMWTDVNHPLVQAYCKALENNGKTPEFHSENGSSDARFYTKMGIPAIVAQPEGGGHHSEGEYVSIESIELFYRVVKDFVQNAMAVDTFVDSQN